MLKPEPTGSSCSVTGRTILLEYWLYPVALVEQMSVNSLHGKVDGTC